MDDSTPPPTPEQVPQQVSPITPSPQSLFKKHWLWFLGGFVALALAGISIYMLSVQKQIETLAPSPMPTRAVTPTPVDETVYTEASRSTNWKTYTNVKGEYSIKYPTELNVTENTATYANQTIPSAVINPPHASGELAESIIINVRDVLVSSTINDYLTQTVWSGTHPGNINSTVFTLDSISGVRTKDIPGQFEYDTVVVKNGAKVYDIRLLKAASNINWKIIDTDQFNQILSTFQFTN